MDKSPPTPLSVFASHSRLWREHRYVYPVISRRSRGLSVGVNLNPDKICNFGCIYCQVDRSDEGQRPQPLDMAVVRQELEVILSLALSGEIWQDPMFADTPEAFRVLSDIAFSGDAEPTSSPNFEDVVKAAIEVKTQLNLPQVKLVLITNATLLQRPAVVRSLIAMDDHQGEIWAKLDAGTEAYFQMIDHTKVPFKRVLENIQIAGSSRPLAIQSMIAQVAGKPMPLVEQQAYVGRLDDLMALGCQIKQVQLYTVARPPAQSNVQPVTKAFLEQLRDQIHAVRPTLAVDLF